MTLFKLKFKKVFLCFLAMSMIMFLFGCSPVGPNYEPPVNKLSENWHTDMENGINNKEIDPNVLAGWWTTINDPILTNLIVHAKENNLDIKRAYARIRESRARRNMTITSLYPSVNLSGSLTSTITEDDRSANDLYSAGLDASWEMDIFGGTRRSIEAVNADLQSVQEDLHNVLVSLTAEVALNYIDIRTYQARLTAVEESINAQTETYQLTTWRYEAELNDELAVQQAQYNLESSRSQIPALRAGLKQLMNSLAVLLGEEPGKIDDEVIIPEPIPSAPNNITIGVPVDIIRQRPDIRSAERSLAAQTARIGVAKASLYPSFTLNGSFGLSADSFSDISSAPWTLSGGPRLSLPVFDAGAIRQNIIIQSALTEQLLIQYESTVLNAMNEVENALISYVSEQQKRESLQKAAQSAKSAAELARQKFEAGLTDFSDVLDSQRSVLSFQDQLAQSNGAVISNLIRLYKALGGGWTHSDYND